MYKYKAYLNIHTISPGSNYIWRWHTWDNDILGKELSLHSTLHAALCMCVSKEAFPDCLVTHERHHFSSSFLYSATSINYLHIQALSPRELLVDGGQRDKDRQRVIYVNQPVSSGPQMGLLHVQIKQVFKMFKYNWCRWNTLTEYIV